MKKHQVSNAYILRVRIIWNLISKNIECAPFFLRTTLNSHLVGLCSVNVISKKIKKYVLTYDFDRKLTFFIPFSFFKTHQPSCVSHRYFSLNQFKALSLNLMEHLILVIQK